MREVAVARFLDIASDLPGMPWVEFASALEGGGSRSLEDMHGARQDLAAPGQVELSCGLQRSVLGPTWTMLNELASPTAAHLPAFRSVQSFVSERMVAHLGYPFTRRTLCMVGAAVQNPIANCNAANAQWPRRECWEAGVWY